MEQSSVPARPSGCDLLDITTIIGSMLLDDKLIHKPGFLNAVQVKAPARWLGRQ